MTYYLYNFSRLSKPHFVKPYLLRKKLINVSTLIVFSLSHLRNSTLRYERLSRTKFVIRAVIYMQDRDQFELTKYLTPAQFKKGNQFDDEWFDRISKYVDHVVGQIYEEDFRISLS